jgi:hypothetical protein
MNGRGRKTPATVCKCCGRPMVCYCSGRRERWQVQHLVCQCGNTEKRVIDARLAKRKSVKIP